MIRIHKAMKTFTIEATFGDQMIRSAAPRTNTLFIDPPE